MDQEIEIINKETRIEKIKTFLIKEKNKLIASLVIILLIIIGFFLYEESKKKKTIALSNKFNSLTLNYKSKDIREISLALKEIINAKNKTYSPLALFFIIDNNLVSSKEEINTYFDIIINEIKIDNEIKNLIIYKKALYNSDFETENNLIEILKPVINSKSIWKSHALYLMGEYFFSKGEKKKSLEFYEKILQLENSNYDIKLEAQRRISRDFSE